MAETEIERPMTLKERMALLNAAQIGRSPLESPIVQKPKPQLPDRRPIAKQKSFNIPSENTVATIPPPQIANLPRGPPPLPARNKQPPPLPVRKASNQETVVAERTIAKPGGYNGPRVTATRTKSDDNGPRIKAPAWGECELPPLPTKPETKTRTKSVTERPEAVNRSPSVSSIGSAITTLSNASRQTQPPQLPSRQQSTDSVTSTAQRKVPPLPSNDILERARKASFTSNHVPNENPPPVPALPARRPSGISNVLEKARASIESTSLNDAPPPVPRSSRPDLSALQATKPKLNEPCGNQTTAVSECLVCRDFSAQDQHATLFPRQQVRSLQELSYQLTSPFPSLTDKARTIMTWLHHNIDYNTQAFFSGNVQSSTPQSTLQTGLAVCEGYAALFANLATYAGLEAIVISGHGKGYGFQTLPPGAPLPPFECGHAWNAVRIDDGEWKLVDPCWYSGHVQGANMPYVRQLAPERFTQSNEEFGVDHFPSNQEHFFLPNARTISWEEYIQRNSTQWPYQFEPITFFDNAKKDYDIGKHTVKPPQRKIAINKGDSIRFQFGLFCPHWSLEKHSKKGAPPVFILAAGGVDGRNKHYIPLEHVRPSSPGSGGDMWYVDVAPRELGAPGETLTMFAVTSFGNMQNARGLTVQEFKNGVGRVGMGFTGVAAWELV